MTETTEKLDVKNYNISLLNIHNPIKRKTGYNSKIMYKGKDFKVQTPLCTVKDINLKSDKPFILLSFKIASNFSYLQFFSNIHELCIENLIKNSTNSSYDILKNVNGEEEVRKAFQTTVKKNNDVEMTIRMKINKSTLYFDKEQKVISGLEIQKDDKIVCIIKTNGLVADNNTSSQVWVCLQCLKFK